MQRGRRRTGLESRFIDFRRRFCGRILCESVGNCRSPTFHLVLYANLRAKMTLDILHFIDSKGGNAQEIRDSQKKRGHSVELVDEIVQMYADWVKSVCIASHPGRSTPTLTPIQWTLTLLAPRRRRTISKRKSQPRKR